MLVSSLGVVANGSHTAGSCSTRSDAEALYVPRGGRVGLGGGCCRFVSRTFDVMMFLLPTHAFVVHCPPDRSWLPMCEPRVKLSSRTCPLQFFADFRSTTETPLVGCRSNRALSPVTCRMLRRRVPPELCVSCAVVEVWRRLDLSPRGPRVPAHLESLPFTRASDSCVVLWEDAQDSLGAQDPALLRSCCPTPCHSSEGTREREGCAFSGSVRASQM